MAGPQAGEAGLEGPGMTDKRDSTIKQNGPDLSGRSALGRSNEPSVHRAAARRIVHIWISPERIGWNGCLTKLTVRTRDVDTGVRADADADIRILPNAGINKRIGRQFPTP
jgi:hypothetical protein